MDEAQQNKFFYKASQKVPFYFIYYSSPENTAHEMMVKYLENPINALSFITYDQIIRDGRREIELSNLALNDPRIHRKIHVN